MSPAWYTSIILVSVVQVTFGVNPPDSILSATVEKVLQGVEAQLAQLEHLFVEQIEAMEVRLSAKTDALKTSLVDNKATMETRFAGQTVELEMRLAQHNRGMEVVLEGLKASLTGSISAQLGAFEERMINENHRVAENTSARLNDHLTNANHTMEALLLGMKDTMNNEIKKPAAIPECRPNEEHVMSNCTIGTLLRDMEERLISENHKAARQNQAHLTDNLTQTNITVSGLILGMQESLLNEQKSLMHSLEARLSSEAFYSRRMMNETKALVHGLEESVTSECRHITNNTETLLRETRVHSNTTESLMRESFVHSNQTARGLLLDLGERMVVETHNGTNTTKIELEDDISQINETVRARLRSLEERMVVETDNGTNTTKIELEDDISQINETVRARLRSLEALVSTLCSSRDTQELYPVIHNSSNTQLPILTLLKSCGEITFLRRVDGSVNFTRTWADYTSGFGNESGEFWLGLETLHLLTTQHEYGMRIDMEDWSSQTKWAEYQSFKVGNESGYYVLGVSGFILNSTTAKDSMAHHNGRPFTTVDKDNDDLSDVNCAVKDRGGWWYGRTPNAYCHFTNPTGEYHPAGYRGEQGIQWYHAFGDSRSLKAISLKLIRN